MRAPPPSNAAETGSGLGSPGLIVVLVLLLGATIYLWRTRYMRRKTAYLLMAVLGFAIIVVGMMMYQSRI